MRRTIIAVTALFAAFSASADFTFKPFTPTSDRTVVAIVRELWRDTCLPRNPVVTNVNHIIDVRWTIGDCISVGLPAAWNDDVPLGVLEPGTYTVRFFVDADLIATKSLVVTAKNAQFEILPSYASTRGGTRISISQQLCEASITEVRIAGSAVAIEPSCDVASIAPPHAAGAVDVDIFTLQTSVHLPSRLQYLDPASPVNTAVFDRVLLPILYDGPGAFGSNWVTEGVIDGGTFQWFHDFERAECAGGCSSTTTLSDFRNHPNGMIVSVPREFSDRIRFSPLRVRDVSRAASTWGAEVPVVREREFIRGDLVFANVPFDPRYRITLRLYSLTGLSLPWFVSANQGQRKLVQLHGTCTSTPCANALPSFAASDLRALFPQNANDATVRVEGSIEPKWGFITVTNNETQIVSVITPMR